MKKCSLHSEPGCQCVKIEEELCDRATRLWKQVHSTERLIEVRCPTVACMHVMVRKKSVEEEPFDRLVHIAIHGAMCYDDEGRECPNFRPLGDYRQLMCTADELIRVCYAARDERSPEERCIQDRDVVIVDPDVLCRLSYRHWMVYEVCVVDAAGREYARWNPQRLLAALKQMRETA